jgi:hypothetical protein
VYSTKTEDRINFNKIEVLANTHTYYLIFIREANKIVKHPHNFNCDERYEVSRVWLHLYSANPSS